MKTDMEFKVQEEFFHTGKWGFFILTEEHMFSSNLIRLVLVKYSKIMTEQQWKDLLLKYGGYMNTTDAGIFSMFLSQEQAQAFIVDLEPYMTASVMAGAWEEYMW